VWKPHCVPISSQALPGIPYDDSGKVLIVQQEKLLKSAVSDYIDRIVDGRGLRQRVITQPRPKPDFTLRLAVTTMSFRGKTERPWYRRRHDVSTGSDIGKRRFSTHATSN
jgi:hypothetical protein